jgi:hypothetical protein
MMSASTHVLFHEEQRFRQWEQKLIAERVRVAPILPDGIRLEVTGIALGDGHLDLEVEGGDVRVLAAPDGIDVDLVSDPP